MRGAVPIADVSVTTATRPYPSMQPGFGLDPGFARFAWVLLWYVVALAVLATLSPFDFDFAHPHGLNWETTDSDVALNLAFLFPVGFLLRLARNERGWSYGLDGLLLGLALSALLEFTQSSLPSRVSSPTDVATNGLGAWAGALTCARIAPWLDRRLHKQLSLHLPLANIVYLLVPLLALNALAMHEFYDWLPQLPLAVFLAFVAAGLYKHRLEGSERPFAFYYALAIGALFGIGCLPMCQSAPQLWAANIVGMAALTRLVIAVGTRMPESERRFVPLTIQRALPWFIAYLYALALREASVVAVASEQGQGQQIAALSLLRDVASFSVLGYLNSELEARSFARTWAIVAHACAVGASIALCFVVTRLGLWAMLHDGLGQLGLLTGAALAGAVIHRSQIRLVRNWGRTAGPPGTSHFPGA